MTRLRRTTHCPVPGHGTTCVLADECPPFYERPTEEHLALRYELEADAEMSIVPLASSSGHPNVNDYKEDR